MAKRFFTSDFHLGMKDILRFAKRGKEFGGPFENINQMNEHLLKCCRDTTSEHDIILHLGDLCQYNDDRGNPGLGIKPMKLIEQIPASFINIRGNHDLQNRVKSLCESMQTHLGKRYPNVTVGHYPSYDLHAKNYVKNGWIHLCGHVHDRWRHCLDLDKKILNINVGVDVWGYHLVSEEELVQYINSILKMPKEKLCKVKQNKEGKIINV